MAKQVDLVWDDEAPIVPGHDGRPESLRNYSPIHTLSSSCINSTTVDAWYLSQKEQSDLDIEAFIDKHSVYNATTKLYSWPLFEISPELGLEHTTSQFHSLIELILTGFHLNEEKQGRRRVWLTRKSESKADDMPAPDLCVTGDGSYFKSEPREIPQPSYNRLLWAARVGEEYQRTCWESGCIVGSLESLATHIFVAQPNRRAVRIPYFFMEEGLYPASMLFHFDRSGARYTLVEHSIAKDPKSFIRMICGLSSSRSRRAGFNPTISWKTIVDEMPTPPTEKASSATTVSTATSKPSTASTTPTNKRQGYILSHTHEHAIEYKITKGGAFDVQVGVQGAGGVCWPVVDGEGQHLVIKDTWILRPQSRRAASDMRMLRDAKGLQGVCQIVDYTFQFTTFVFLDRKHPSKKEVVRPFENEEYSFYRVVLKEYGPACDQFSSPLQLFTAFRDAVLGHRNLRSQGLFYGNFSISNIRLGEEGVEEISPGILFDLENVTTIHSARNNGTAPLPDHSLLSLYTCLHRIMRGQSSDGSVYYKSTDPDYLRDEGNLVPERPSDEERLSIERRWGATGAWLMVKLNGFFHSLYQAPFPFMGEVGLSGSEREKECQVTYDKLLDIFNKVISCLEEDQHLPPEVILETPKPVQDYDDDGNPTSPRYRPFDLPPTPDLPARRKRKLLCDEPDENKDEHPGERILKKLKLYRFRFSHVGSVANNEDYERDSKELKICDFSSSHVDPVADEDDDEHENKRFRVPCDFINSNLNHVDYDSDGDDDEHEDNFKLKMCDFSSGYVDSDDDA